MSEEKKILKKPRSKSLLPVVVETIEDIIVVDEPDNQPDIAPWSMRIAGLKTEIIISAMKMPTFTTGMLNRGDITIEVVNTPQIPLNAYFRLWMATPSLRAVELDVFDADGDKIEMWKMNAVPAVMGFSEFSTFAEDPWATQIMFSVSDIKIEASQKY